MSEVWPILESYTLKNCFQDMHQHLGVNLKDTNPAKLEIHSLETIVESTAG